MILCLYYPDMCDSLYQFNFSDCTFSIITLASFAPSVLSLNIYLLCSFMLGLSQRHCSLSLSNYVSTFLSNFLVTDSDADFWSMASFCISSIALSRSFVGFLMKSISRSNFRLAENSFLLKFLNMLLRYIKKIITRLVLFWRRQYSIIFLLYHFFACSSSFCSSFLHCIYKRVELFSCFVYALLKIKHLVLLLFLG